MSTTPSREAVMEALRHAQWRGLDSGVEVPDVAAAINAVVFALAPGIFKLAPAQHQQCIDGLATLYPEDSTT